MVEEGVGGLCTARLMEDRTSEAIDAILMANVNEGSTLVSDEWPAHRNLKHRLANMYGFHLTEHRMVKHKETFCETIEREDGTILKIHTNKEEGLHAHLKAKMKRIFGTCVDNVEGYVAEEVFKLNARARMTTPFVAFLDFIAV